jgi:hypothetical protein
VTKQAVNLAEFSLGWTQRPLFLRASESHLGEAVLTSRLSSQGMPYGSNAGPCPWILHVKQSPRSSPPRPTSQLTPDFTNPPPAIGTPASMPQTPKSLTFHYPVSFQGGDILSTSG